MQLLVMQFLLTDHLCWSFQVEGPQLMQHGFKDAIAKVGLTKFISDLFWVGMFYHLYNQVIAWHIGRLISINADMLRIEMIPLLVWLKEFDAWIHWNGQRSVASDAPIKNWKMGLLGVSAFLVD